MHFITKAKAFIDAVLKVCKFTNLPNPGTPTMTKALFILKRREDYSSDPSYSGSYQIATGMWNSAKFVSDALNSIDGVTSNVAIAVDGNSIDALCMQYDPDVVFIEGLWVTPAKFTELMGLARHAKRTFVVRIHSEIPFLATEGIAMD